MEAFYFLKFWRPATTTHRENRPSSGSSDDTTGIPFTDCEFEEGDDSFFELELTVPDFDTNKRSSSMKNNHPPDRDSNIFDCKQAALHNLAAGEISSPRHTFHPPTHSADHLLSKRKILPIEPISLNPQSPISPLKSAPRSKILMFKKSKSMASQKTEKTGETEYLKANNKKHESNKLFTVKFKLEEVTNISFFTKQNSLRKQIPHESDDNDTSKRFSKEMIQKAKEKQVSFPAGIRVVTRHLGKSKSASATTGVSPPIASRRDDSLLLQHDGIQSAILHCKKSFNSSRDSSLISRFASDPLHEKSMSSPRTSSSE
ncbi:hypothetical protein OIU84_001991 [Salix udensis]|uniref:Membrane-associated kinase regulator 5 n=1 Tax=Salix udensis TaxID=889485 RepID=A0AAD6K9R1_9ROSI|nr:hypothetical protein OIU84_001991 [Salix udensis]